VGLNACICKCGLSVYAICIECKKCARVRGRMYLCIRVLVCMCVCACMCMYMRMCVHVCVRVCARVCVRVRTRACMRMRTRVGEHVHTFKRMRLKVPISHWDKPLISIGSRQSACRFDR